MSSVKTVSYSKDALKTLRRMPRNLAGLIVSKIEAYAADRASQANNVKALQGGAGQFRLRVGDWRVIMTEDGQVISVIRIATRGQVYKD